MKSRDADPGHGPGRDRERRRLSGSISNAEGGVLGTILWDGSYLGSSPIVICYNSKSVRRLTTGNILKVSYIVL